MGPVNPRTMVCCNDSVTFEIDALDRRLQITSS